MYKRIILTGLVLGFSVGLFSQVNPDTLPEKYIPKVIIEAKWGDGPGEFGFKPDSEIPPDGIGPCGLTVDNGYLYILDAINRRIEVYSTQGTYKNFIELKKNLNIDFFCLSTALGRDEKGYFYLLGSHSGGSKILKFDSTGNFVKELCKSPIDEKANQAPIYLPPPLLRVKEKHDSLSLLLENYDSIGKRVPSNLKEEYDSLGRILEDFRSRMGRKEPLRIPFEPGFKIKGDTLLVKVEKGNFLFINKNTGKIIKEKDRIKGRIRRWRYFGDYPEVIKKGIGLSKVIKEFVLDARRNVLTMSAIGFDEEGNFYELLWKPYGKHLKMGVKVIKWEKVK